MDSRRQEELFTHPCQGCFSNPAKVNKERYALLTDRRRALHDVDRLLGTIQRHARWTTLTSQQPWLHHELERPLAQLHQDLTPHASRANMDTLLKDNQRIYAELTRLARIWASLETGKPL